MSVAVTIPAHYNTQFNANLVHLLQQKGSKLRPFIAEQGVEGEASFHDRIGATEAVELTTRYADTPLVIPVHDRRMITPRNATWATLLDTLDKVKLVTNPTSSYVQAARWSLGRKVDDFIIDAFFADAYSGRTGDTAVTFDANNVVAVNAHRYDTNSGNVGLTISKLQHAHDIFATNQVDPDEVRHIACAQRQINDLLSDNKLSSADFNTVRALQAGEINTFMKYQFHQIERLKTDSNSYRRVMVWVQRGMLLGVLSDLETRLDQRPDKNYAFQAWAQMILNAVRMEEGACIEIKCYEA